jgi:hypothetical protein
MDLNRTSDADPATEGPQWVCHNCGTFNSAAATHCKECGFAKGFDPESAAAVVHATVPPEIMAAEAAPPRLLLYLGLAQLLATLVLLGFLLPILMRLNQNWPFQSPYDADARELATKVMTIEAQLDMGITKGEYDTLLAPVLGDNARFKAMYGARPERQRDSYQKLVQAAEFLGLAEKSWDVQLSEAQLPLSMLDQARSKEASKDVQTYWDRAKTHATEAVADL